MTNLRKYRLSKVKPAMVHFRPPHDEAEHLDRLLAEGAERPNMLIIEHLEDMTVQFIPCGHPRVRYTSSL